MQMTPHQVIGWNDYVVSGADLLPRDASSIISQLSDKLENKKHQLIEEEREILELQDVFMNVLETGSSFRCYDVKQSRNLKRILNSIVTNLAFHYDSSEIGVSYDNNHCRFITGIEKLIGQEITIIFEYADSYPPYSKDFQYGEPVNFIICRTGDLWREMQSIHNRN